MKTLSLSKLAPLAAALFACASGATGSEKQDSPASAPMQRAVPIQNYWDANSWDPIGGSLFWHAIRDSHQARASATESGRNTRHRDSRRPTTTPSRTSDR